MNISNYRSFIRERKREVNKLTPGLSTDSTFETKVNYLLEGQITSLEFETYLENDLYLNINESYLINESLATKFADNVKSKIKSLFNNLYQKLKETNGFQMIISFFEKVVSGISKFWKFLKKVQAGKILKKLAITLGITSLASYILAQFGAGWVALMGGRMTASMIGKKVGDKFVKEKLNYLSLFEQFNNIKELNDFLSKINVTTNKLNSNLIINFYKNVIDGKFQSKFDKWKDVLISHLKHLRNATNSRNESRIKESLLMLKNHLKINDDGKSDIISDGNLKSYLSKSDGRKWGNLHAEILSILSGYNLISDKQNLNKVDIEKDVSKKKDVKLDEPSNKESDKESSYKSSAEKEEKKESKKSIWSKIGGSISKFFKIFRKLKWAIVIFFGVVFILNLIFYPIFEPILQVAQVSSFSMILSDTFEETANAVSSIPKVNLDDVKINTDITGELPSDSEVTKTIQGAVNDIKGNIEGNEELAAEEADDIVQKSFNETRTGSINLSELDDEMFNKLPNSFVASESPDLSFAHNLKYMNTRNAIGKAFADGDNYSVSMRGSVDDLYQFKTFTYEQSNGYTVYKIIAVKRDSIGGDDLSVERWRKALDENGFDGKNYKINDISDLNLKIDQEITQSQKQHIAMNKLLNRLGQQDGVSANFSDASKYYDIQVYYDKDDNLYTAIAIKRDSIGEEVSDEKWNEVLGKKDINPSQEVEQKGNFWKNLKDKAKDALNITDGDKYVRGLEKDGWNFYSTTKPGDDSHIKYIINNINEKGIEYDNSDFEQKIPKKLLTGAGSESTYGHIKDKFLNSEEFKNLPDNTKKEIRNHTSKYLIYTEDGDKVKLKFLIPKNVSDIQGDELVEQLESKTREIAKVLRENGYDNSPGDLPMDYQIYNSLKNGKLSPEDLEKLKDINSNDFYTSVSKIKQNGFVALQDKLYRDGIKPNSNYMFFKELDNGSIQWFYLIPKK